MFIGHKKQLKFLTDMLLADKISQAYLFSGPESIGKFFLARAFALALVKKDAKLLSERMVNAENKNQDIEIISPEIIEKKGVIKTKDIDVEKIRIAQRNLALFPAVGSYRVLIINDAHRLTGTAQNALLKTLEEPNNASIIILVTSEDGKILKTVKSRCQKINFNLVALEDIKEGFKNELNNALLEKVAIFSMGKPGEAKKIIQDPLKIEEQEQTMKELASLRSMTIGEKFDLAEVYSKNLNQTKRRLEFWIWMIRVQAYRNLKEINKIENNYTIIDKIDVALKKMKNPSFNSRLILENLFLNL